MTSRRAPSRRSCVSRLFLSGRLQSPNSNEVDSVDLLAWGCPSANQASVTQRVRAHRSGGHDFAQRSFALSRIGRA
jgi:hypothetical protein